jgi:hypothetical protein
MEPGRAHDVALVLKASVDANDALIRGDVDRYRELVSWRMTLL